MSQTALLLLLLLANGPAPKAELVPLRKVTNLPMGRCDVEVTVRLSVDNGGVEDYYCPRIEWVWEDGTVSVEESDCPPFAEAKSENRRRSWTRSRGYQTRGRFIVRARLFKGDRYIRTVETTVVIMGWSGYPPEQRQENGCTPARILPPPVPFGPELLKPSW